MISVVMYCPKFSGIESINNALLEQGDKSPPPCVLVCPTETTMTTKSMEVHFFISQLRKLLNGSDYQRGIVDRRVPTVTNCDLRARLKLTDLFFQPRNREQIVIVDRENHVSGLDSGLIGWSARSQSCERYSVVANIWIPVRKYTNRRLHEHLATRGAISWFRIDGIGRGMDLGHTSGAGTSLFSHGDRVSLLHSKIVNICRHALAARQVQRVFALGECCRGSDFVNVTIHLSAE